MYLVILEGGMETQITRKANACSKSLLQLSANENIFLGILWEEKDLCLPNLCTGSSMRGS